jgi:uncharacterized MAPEG superfamily protein
MHDAAPIVVQLLGGSVLLLFAHIAVQGGLTLPERGLRWNAGPRDGWHPPDGRWAGRAERALANFKETYPAFIALALGLALMGKTTGGGALGAWLWFIARIFYLPLYLLGTPWLRTLAYAVSFVGLIMMLVALF